VYVTTRVRDSRNNDSPCRTISCNSSTAAPAAGAAQDGACLQHLCHDRAHSIMLAASSGTQDQALQVCPGAIIA
jgi:hypothetical protein